jgi:hypothetical protein
VRASEISEMLSQTLTQTLVRWIVDLNFGTDVAAPVLTREFRIEESPLTMPDVSLLIQSGYTPRKEWIERHFRVELEDKSGSEENAQEGTTYDPQKDQDLFGSIFGDQTGPTQEQKAAAGADLAAAQGELAPPEGAIPEESDAGMIQSATPEDELAQAIEETPEPEQEKQETEITLEDLLGEDEDEEKPFGNERITEDEATQMAR